MGGVGFPSFRSLCTAAVLLSWSPGVSAQEHEPEPHESDDHAGAHGMPAGPLGVPPAREASGTSWQPDLTPMFATHYAAGRWTLMLHGNGFLGWNDQRGRRGATQVSAPHWAMFMARRPLGGGIFNGRMMVSLEPFVFPESGYPLLLQSGETAGGEPLHDRQHPHDLFMELAAEYSRALGRNLAFQIYGGPSGEPAIGPTAFPHRTSAFSDPLAPLGHHWQDATHITFGVVTAGLFTRHLKIEGSVFNGREPDEARLGFDFGPLDSWAVRFHANPHPQLGFQVSHGFLREPEQIATDVNVARTTASGTWHAPLAGGGLAATTLLFGRNREIGEASTDAWLLETRVAPAGRNVVYGRVEHIGKTGHDLVLPDEALEHEVFVIDSFVLGYERELGAWSGVVPAVGGRIARNFLPPDLEPFYGTTDPTGFMVYLHLRPAAMPGRARSGSHAH